VPQTKYE
jgi:hypothetical protein